MLAVQLRPKSSSAYYFDSYGIVPLVPNIQAFIKRNCRTWDYNRRQMQGLSNDAFGKVLLYIPPLHGSGLHNEKIHLAIRCVQRSRPAGGAAVHYQIRGPDITWQLGSMLPQLPIKR